jgi:hypothetical protein
LERLDFYGIYTTVRQLTWLVYKAFANLGAKIKTRFSRISLISADNNICRVACVWFILGLVFQIRTGKPCFIADHFRELLLPCTKTEWEAKTESQWRKEHDNAAGSTTALHTFGDLIDAHRRLLGVQMSDGLGMWNAGIDHLGMVLNLAVHMV